MKKMFILLALLLFPKTSIAQVQVVQDLGMWGKAAEQIAEYKKMLDAQLKQLDVIKEQYDTVKGIASNVGEAISIGQSAVEWVTSDNQNMSECLIPAVQAFNPLFNTKTHDLCSSQDFVRKKLGVPTTQDIEKGISDGQNLAENWGNHDWKNAVKRDVNGKKVLQFSPEFIFEKRANQEQLASSSRISSVAVAHSYLNEKVQKNIKNLKGITNNLSTKPNTTNDLLMQLITIQLASYENDIYIGSLLANSLQLQASDSLLDNEIY